MQVEFIILYTIFYCPYEKHFVCSMKQSQSGADCAAILLFLKSDSA